MADSAYALALIYRDPDPEAFDLVLVHHEDRFDYANRGRAAFYARRKLLEYIAHAVSTPGRPPYPYAPANARIISHPRHQESGLLSFA